METISAKIPEDLKRALAEEEINVSETVRQALAAEVERRRRGRLTDQAETLAREIDRRVDVEDVLEQVVADVRRSREDR